MSAFSDFLDLFTIVLAIVLVYIGVSHHDMFMLCSGGFLWVIAKMDFNDKMLTRTVERLKVK